MDECLAADGVNKFFIKGKFGEFSRKQFAWSRPAFGSIVNFVSIMTPKFLTCPPVVITVDSTFKSGRFFNGRVFLNNHQHFSYVIIQF